MKKKGLIIFIAIMIATMCMALAACNDGEGGDPTHIHTPNPDDGDCTTPITCSVCGEITTPAKSHVSSKNWESDDSHHWNKCSNDGCTKLAVEKEAHSYLNGSNVCKCGKIDTSIFSGTADTLVDCEPGEYTELTVPNTYTVIKGGAFNGWCGNVKKIILPEGITEIGQATFAYCRSLTDVNVPDSVTSIGANAFKECKALPKINLPEGITSIGNNAFYDCEMLESITLPDSLESLGENAFDACMALTDVKIGTNLTKIEESTFYFCKSLTAINIPDNITEIGANAFAECHSLEAVEIPNSVTTLGISAFSGCYALKSISVGNGITELPEYVFNSNLLLTDVTLSNRLASIGQYAFRQCYALETIHIPDSVINIGEYAFTYCTALKNISLSTQMTEITQYTFNNCTSLISIIIPDGVTSIGDYAFRFCRGLENITIPDSLTSIGAAVFDDCPSLTNISLPSSLATIKKSAFSGCRALTVYAVSTSKPTGWVADWNIIDSKNNRAPVVWNSRTTSVANDGNVYTVENGIRYATNDKTKVKKVVRQPYSLAGDILIDVPIIDREAFYDCNYITGVTLGASVTTIGYNAFGACPSISKLDVAAENQKYRADGNCIIEKATKTLVQGCYTSVIPKDGSVTKIGNCAFVNLGKQFTHIEIPSSVITIGNSAFFGCLWLKSIVLPDGLKTLGQEVFYDCFRLENVILPKSLEKIGSYAFYRCIGLKQIVIPQGVLSMGSWVFAGLKEGEVDIKIYVEAAQSIEDEYWNYQWNHKTKETNSPRYDVVWEYKGEQA